MMWEETDIDFITYRGQMTKEFIRYGRDKVDSILATFKLDDA
jgi:hypothetical protein